MPKQQRLHFPTGRKEPIINLSIRALLQQQKKELLKSLNNDVNKQNVSLYHLCI